MAQDDVERLVRWVADGCSGRSDVEPYVEDARRLARIVRELLAVMPTGGPCDLKRSHEDCIPCHNRALRERLNRLARGENV